MARALTLGAMETNTPAIGMRTIFRVMEYIHGLTEKEV